MSQVTGRIRSVAAVATGVGVDTLPARIQRRGILGCIAPRHTAVRREWLKQDSAISEAGDIPRHEELGAMISVLQHSKSKVLNDYRTYRVPPPHSKGFRKPDENLGGSFGLHHLDFRSSLSSLQSTRSLASEPVEEADINASISSSRSDIDEPGNRAQDLLLLDSELDVPPVPSAASNPADELSDSVPLDPYTALVLPDPQRSRFSPISGPIFGGTVAPNNPDFSTLSVKPKGVPLWPGITLIDDADKRRLEEIKAQADRNKQIYTQREQRRFANMMRAHATAGEVDAIRRLLRAMYETSVPITPFHYHQLLTAYKKAGDHKGGLQAVHEMKALGLKLDSFSYNNQMVLSSMAGKKENLEVLLDEMLNNGVQPDKHTFGTLFREFVTMGKLSRALEVVRSMVDSGSTTFVHYVEKATRRVRSRITLPKDFKNPREAGGYMSSIILEGFVRNKDMHGILEAMEFFEQHQMKPSPPAMLQIYSLHAEIDPARALKNKELVDFFSGATTVSQACELIMTAAEFIKIDLAEGLCLLYKERFAAEGLGALERLYRAMLLAYVAAGYPIGTWRFYEFMRANGLEIDDLDIVEFMTKSYDRGAQVCQKRADKLEEEERKLQKREQRLKEASLAYPNMSSVRSVVRDSGIREAPAGLGFPSTPTTEANEVETDTVC